MKNNIKNYTAWEANSTILSSDLTHVSPTKESSPSIMSRLKQAAMSKYLAIALLATAPAMQSCEKTETKIDPIVQVPAKPTEAQLETWHQEAEAYATAQGWSQGVKSLAAGELDYFYFKESANGPILIRVCYNIDINDFIKKIEADAANRGTYDPKTEGVFQANLISLEGDKKRNIWFVPSSAIYEAKEQGKSKLELKPGQFPAPSEGYNTIGENEGIAPAKQMQIYGAYWINNSKYTDPSQRINLPVKTGALKDIL